MTRCRGVRYLAGKWEDSLRDDLLWEGGNSHSSRPSTWRVPTWSWASTLANIYYEDASLFWASDEEFEVRDEDNFQHFSDVLSCECALEGTNQFGKLTSIRLHLSVLCVEAGLVYDVLGDYKPVVQLPRH